MRKDDTNNRASRLVELRNREIAEFEFRFFGILKMYKLEKRIKLEKNDNIENADKKVMIIFLMNNQKKLTNLLFSQNITKF